MTLSTATTANRRVLGWILALSCVSLALAGCGGRASESTGTSNAGGSGTDPGGAGGGNTGGAAGIGGTGTSGATGSGGVAGAGVAGAGGAGEDSCMSVAGAGDEPWFDLTIVGTEFHADEGEHMRIVVATQDGNRVGIADLPIVDGAEQRMVRRRHSLRGQERQRHLRDRRTRVGLGDASRRGRCLVRYDAG